MAKQGAWETADECARVTGWGERMVEPMGATIDWVIVMVEQMDST